jgi:hypothetical protein
VRTYAENLSQDENGTAAVERRGKARKRKVQKRERRRERKESAPADKSVQCEKK